MKTKVTISIAMLGLIILAGISTLGCPAPGISTPDFSSKDDKAITGFGFVDESAMGRINEAQFIITVVVPADCDVSKLTPIVSYNGVSITPASLQEVDFTDPVTYTVTAYDGTTQDYIVSVHRATEGLVYSPINGDSEYEVSGGGAASSADEIFIPDYYLGRPVSSIGIEAFSSYTDLCRITIPSGIASIGSRAFWGCTSLESITLPEGLVEIGENAFVSCIALATLALPHSLTDIANGGFYNCQKLTSIVIGDDIASIGDIVFGNCYDVTNLYIHAMTAPVLGIDVFDSIGSDEGGCTLHIYSGASGYDASQWTDSFSSIVYDL